ncbi:protein serine threonine [Stylonychia lemnae]|uniref:Protein serine threonine n=1 Tax=Stylonychia lemnae TaxID=5949 RepID=A0A078A3D8_STYLE|nr:protein serine threonine [Stylonychia lemnae]|eukprot:CDW76692.1 protein serine threonine [Stylonychia lemnae]
MRSHNRQVKTIASSLTQKELNQKEQYHKNLDLRIRGMKEDNHSKTVLEEHPNYQQLNIQSNENSSILNLEEQIKLVSKRNKEVMHIQENQYERHFEAFSKKKLIYKQGYTSNASRLVDVFNPKNDVFEIPQDNNVLPNVFDLSNGQETASNNMLTGSSEPEKTQVYYQQARQRDDVQARAVKANKIDELADGPLNQNTKIDYSYDVTRLKSSLKIKIAQQNQSDTNNQNFTEGMQSPDNLYDEKKNENLKFSQKTQQQYQYGTIGVIKQKDFPYQVWVNNHLKIWLFSVPLLLIQLINNLSLEIWSHFGISSGSILLFTLILDLIELIRFRNYYKEKVKYQQLVQLIRLENSNDSINLRGHPDDEIQLFSWHPINFTKQSMTRYIYKYTSIGLIIIAGVILISFYVIKDLECPFGYYTFRDTICLKCEDSSCKICDHSGKCTQCYDNYFKDSYSKCALCSSSIQGCNTCQSANKCTICQNNFLLNKSFYNCTSCPDTNSGCLKSQNNLITECLPGYSFNNQTKSCLRCSSITNGCSTCTSSGTCLSCDQKKFKQNLNTKGLCDCNQDLGWITDSKQQGLCKCTSAIILKDETCFQCNRTIEQCSSCINTNYFFTGSVLLVDAINQSFYTGCDMCQIGYYQQVEYGQCMSCNSISAGCTKCSSQVCQSCSSGYRLLSGKCVKSL